MSQSNSKELLRLSKLMSERGICSRREADDYIQRGYVFVNGERITELGTKVTPDVKITLDTPALRQQNNLVTIIMNKPIGYVSGQPEPGYEPAIRLVKDSTQFSNQKRTLQHGDMKNLAVVGRLDIDSQGLLIFTQDGRLAKKLIGENSTVEKEYIVRVEGFLSKDDLARLNFGLELDGEKLKPAKVDWINEDQLRFILKQGKKRQIRRMCELVGLRVTGLKRVRVGKLMLGKLPEGRWRFLDPDEDI
ncbi:MAG: pseudouridylate synthase [Bdellovibrionales bacterium RIFCSPHIGHO2_01_FULL_40_29]|nr:MAG: pseudouridylate synthase [Bdellovibrionales bacterium RIFCSPHIGHO2_01_FULL_40_29]OFZ35611.1 MAG: pseudouridylate synthase [Bdellovibrionales bacterium RIFCSPHIGHO2_02_FULL_40_15]